MNLKERRRRREKLLEKTHVTINKRRSKKLHAPPPLSSLLSPLHARAHTYTFFWRLPIFSFCGPTLIFTTFSWSFFYFPFLLFSNPRFLFFIIFFLSLAYHHLLSSSTSQNFLETTKTLTLSLFLSQFSSFAVVFGLPESLIGFAPYFLVCLMRKV